MTAHVVEEPDSAIFSVRICNASSVSVSGVDIVPLIIRSLRYDSAFLLFNTW